MKTFVGYLVTVLVGFSPFAYAHEHGAHKATSVTPSGDSLFNSGSKWREASGHEIMLSEFRGSKVILTMAYTGCKYTCPLTVTKLKEIEDSLVSKGVTDFKIVLASFDPVRDNPARLSAYMKERKLSNRWVLLCPHSDKDVRELAAIMGVTYARDKQGDFSHSNVITYMDREGVIRNTLDGLGADPKPLVSALTGG